MKIVDNRKPRGNRGSAYGAGKPANPAPADPVAPLRRCPACGIVHRPPCRELISAIREVLMRHQGTP